MKVSVILIGYNSWTFLEKNLASLTFLINDPQAEIIYVDNASSDETLSKIENLYPSIILLKNKENRGVAIARNQGIRIAKGNYLWILDSDTIVNPGAYQGMIQFMDENLEVGLCGCKMYGQDGQIQDSCRRFPSVKEKFSAAIHIIRKKLHLPSWENKGIYYDKKVTQPFEVDYVIGACQLIRKEAQKKVGFLDENFFYGPEDADFCLRMKQAGYRVYYLPQISIYHAYQRISSHQIFSKINKRHIEGLIYYFRKHSGK